MMARTILDSQNKLSNESVPRSYHVLSYGISNLFQYCNEYRYVENGEEAENIELNCYQTAR